MKIKGSAKRKLLKLNSGTDLRESAAELSKISLLLLIYLRTDILSELFSRETIQRLPVHCMPLLSAIQNRLVFFSIMITVHRCIYAEL